MRRVKQFLRAIIPPGPLEKYVVTPYNSFRHLRPISNRTCNACGYQGYFGLAGRPVRIDARCPSCKSLERHRLLLLALDHGDILPTLSPSDKVLHFAAEPVVSRRLRRLHDNYSTADLHHPADLKLNLESIDLPDDSVALIVANHVLEHVNDIKAASELHRILRPGGVLLCMVPIVEGWDTTLEIQEPLDDTSRSLHYGQSDHVRYYGRDFRQRISSGGLRLSEEFTASGEDVAKYGLLRGDKVFVFKKRE